MKPDRMEISEERSGDKPGPELFQFSCIRRDTSAVSFWLRSRRYLCRRFRCGFFLD